MSRAFLARGGELRYPRKLKEIKPDGVRRSSCTDVRSHSIHLNTMVRTAAVAAVCFLFPRS